MECLYFPSFGKQDVDPDAFVVVVRIAKAQRVTPPIFSAEIKKIIDFKLLPATS